MLPPPVFSAPYANLVRVYQFWLGNRLDVPAGRCQRAAVQQEEIWDEVAAREYDTPGTGMFAPDVLGPAVGRLVELAAGGAALEFAIGTGRVAVPLAEAGVPVTGVELSAPMIAQLRTKVDEQAIPVVRGDMASTCVPGAFSLVYLVFNTISNLLTQREQVACFRNAAQHLVPGGRFVIELWVPELRTLPPGQSATVFSTAPGYLGVDAFDVVDQQVVSHHFEFGPAGRQARISRSPHRYIWPSELDLMGQLAGFELETRHADWTGAPFTAESGSHVSVYRLAPAS
jgi:SAM-dependent methyltransferase